NVGCSETVRDPFAALRRLRMTTYLMAIRDAAKPEASSSDARSIHQHQPARRGAIDWWRGRRGAVSIVNARCGKGHPFDSAAYHSFDRGNDSCRRLGHVAGL